MAFLGIGAFLWMVIGGCQDLISKSEASVTDLVVVAFVIAILNYWKDD